MGKIIFKEIYGDIKRYRKEKKQISDDYERSLIIQKETILVDVLKWVSDFKWLSHEETKLRVRLYIKNNFDMNKALEMLNDRPEKDVSYGAFKVSITYASDKLKEILGDNFCKIVSESPEMAKLKFNFVSGEIGFDSLFLDDVRSNIKSKGVIRHALVDCIPELCFLVKYRKRVFEEELKGLDVDKLRYLRRLMSGEDSVALQEGISLVEFMDKAEGYSSEDVINFVMSL